MNSLSVIVPAWGALSSEMIVETGCRWAAFIPYGGMPLYRHIVLAYQKLNIPTAITFIMAEGAPDLQFGTEVQGVEVNVVRLETSKDIGETVLAGLLAKDNPGHVVINLSDTLCTLEHNQLGDSIYVQSRTDLFRWTAVSSSEDGVLRVTSDRQESSASAPQNVCVGIFSLSDGELLRSCLRRALETDSLARESFFAALELYSEIRPLRLTHVDKWLDFGHIDTFYESRLGSFNSRHFNSVSYDPESGIVTKRSEKSDAFRHQVRWYRQIPDSLNAYLPRIFSSSDNADPHISMEVLSLPTLGDLFVYKRVPIGAWNEVIKALVRIQELMRAHKFFSPLARTVAQSVYRDKTVRRIDEFRKMYLGSDDLWIRDKTDSVWNLQRVVECLDEYLTITGALDIDHLSPIHGDFCFSNLFYDVKTRLIKMIDPRGEFGVPGIFGDSRYDYAKLSHSFFGGYDFLVADLFKLYTSSTGELQLKSSLDEYHFRVQEIFEWQVFNTPSLRREVFAIQALLFLSMLPLHAERPRRQLAMLATGLEQFAESWRMAKSS